MSELSYLLALERMHNVSIYIRMLDARSLTMTNLNDPVLNSFFAKKKEAATRKREQEKIDKRVERAYYATCSGIQIDIMDIGKVFEAGRDALRMTPGLNDEQLGIAIRRYVETIRKN